MRTSFTVLLASVAILVPVSVAVAADMESAPVNLMGSELLQMAQTGGSGGSAGGNAPGSVGSGSSGKGSTGLNPRIGPGSSSSPSKSPADDMAKERDEDKWLRDKEKSKGTTP